MIPTENNESSKARSKRQLHDYVQNKGTQTIRQAIEEIDNDFTILCSIINTTFFYFCLSQGLDIDFKDESIEISINRGIDIDWEHIFFQNLGERFDQRELKIYIYIISKDLEEINKYGDIINNKDHNYVFIYPTLDKQEIPQNHQKIFNLFIKREFLVEIWTFEDLVPFLIEYSRYLVFFSDKFKDITIDTLFFIDPDEENRKWANLNNIKQAITKKKYDNLVLCLGAGCSVSEGLPDWDGLLEKIMYCLVKKKNDDEKLGLKDLEYFSKRFHAIEKENPLFEAQLMKVELNSELRKLIKRILKKKYTDKTSNLYDAIVKLCKRYSIKKIINYNYDDILEKKFTTGKYNIIYDESTCTNLTKKSSNKINIIHVHGHLDRPTIKIILSEEDYNFLYDHADDWRNKIQRNSFSHDSCILIGLSIKDPNLRRIMRNTHQERKKKIIYNLPHKAFIKKYTQDDLLNVKGKSLRVGTYEAKKFTAMFNVLKETSYAELGVDVEWYDDHDLIPYMISKL